MALKDTLATVRAAVKARVVAAVPTGTPVHDYFRHLEDEATRAAVAVDASGRLHVWMVTLASEAPVTLPVLGAGHTQAQLAFELHGYLALADASATEKTMDAEVADIIDAFRADKYLGGAAINAWPVERAAGGWIQFTSALCHYARLTVPVRVSYEC